jgi:uncharacterized protein (TIGR02099 family)
MLKFLSFRTSQNSHVLKFLWIISNFIFWLLVFLWSILIGFGLLFHFYFVPHIDRFRPKIETSISEHLGTQFEIGAIQATSNGFFPELEFLDITNTDSTGRSQLRIQRAVASLSTASIFRLTLDKLSVDNCQLTVLKKSDGHFEVAGVTVQPSSDDALVDSFLSIHDVIFNHAQLVWHDELTQLEPITFNDIDLTIKNGIRDHQFRLDATPPPVLSERINFRAQFKQPLLSLHPGQWKQWSGQTYLQATDLKISESLLSFFPSAPWPLQDGAGWFRIWSEVESGSIQNNWVDFDFKNIRLQPKSQNQATQFNTVTGRLHSVPWKAGYAIHTDQLTFSLSGDQDHWDFSNYRLALSNWQDPLGPESEGEFHFQHNTIEHVTQLINNFLPQSPLSNTLSQLNAKGNIDELKLAWGNSTLSEPPSPLKSGLPSWIEKSKNLFNRLSRSKNSISKEPEPKGNENSVSSLLALSHVKHFKIEGSMSNVERAITSLTTLESPWTAASLSPASKSSVPAVLKPLVPATQAKDAFTHVPHFKGLQAKFSMTEQSGSALLTIDKGYFELPGALDQPLIEVSTLSAHADWSVFNGELDFHLSNTSLKNDNGDAHLEIKWFNPDIHHLGFKNLGDIDLDAQVNQLDATALYKYLPSAINPNVRNYLKEAITSGKLQKVKIKIKGPLETFPYKSTHEGLFSISAQLNRLGFNYFPKTFFKSSTLSMTDWPYLSELKGELQIKGRGLSLSSNFANLGFDLNSVQLNKLEAKIPDFLDAVLDITSESKGSLPNYIAIFNKSSLNTRLGRPLEQSKAKGNADLKLKLNLPLNQMDRSKVQGNLTFNNNDIWLTPESPLFFRTRGGMSFTESTLTLQNIQTHTLGGDAKIEGGYRLWPSSSESSFVIKASGNFSSEGLERSCEIPIIRKLSALTKGQSNYTSTVTIKKSGIPEISFSSNLQGLSLWGPGFLKKSSDASLPFSYDTTLVRDLGANHFLERQSITLGDQLALRLFKDSSSLQSTVLSGTLLISPTASASIQHILPPNTSNLARAKPNGWAINAALRDVQLDDWQSAFNGLFFTPTTSNACNQSVFDSNSAELSNQPPLDTNSSLALPSSIQLQADKLNTQGRDFHAVNVQALREGNNWSAQLDSKEVAGSIKFLLDTEPSSRRISAHLNQFTIQPIKNKTTDPLLSNEEPFFPWFDVVVDNFQIKDHRLGRVEFEAHNVLNAKAERYWQLNQVQLSNPDATLKASANWAPNSEPAIKGTQSQIDLALDIHNSGALLSRLGTPGVVKDGRGNMKGQLSWRGSLINPDFDSLSGNFTLEVEKGQFLKTDPGASRLLGVLNLQALPRRLTLDFKDLFGEGFAFDLFKGDIEVREGTASTKNLIMKGVAGTVMLEGSANIGMETQDLRVVVVPEINAGTASLIYSTVNPIVGLTSFIAQYVIRQPLIQANTRTFHISGSWSDPQVTKIDIPIENNK